MRLLQMLTLKSFLLMKIPCLAFYWETYKCVFKNLSIVLPASSLLHS
jgi:hypothetical protein